MFNVDNPSSPVFVGYANNRSTTLSGPDLGAEGIIIIPTSDSPNGNTLVILANEVSSTLSIYQVNTCAEVSGAPITSSDLTICPNQTTQLAVTNTVNVTYEWLLNGTSIPNAVSNTYSANQAGNYSVRVSNSTLGCVDTTASITITSIAPPVVSAGADQTVCGGSNVTLTATGATSYIWNNGSSSSSLTIPTATTASTNVYIVTGTDVTTGCTKKDTVLVIVNGLPQINAGIDFSTCDNAHITLTATGGVNYTWSNNVINGQSFLLAQTTTFTVSGADANGCSNSDQVTVTISNAPQVSLGNDIQICENEAPIQVNSTTNSGGLTYLWNTGDNTSSISTSISGVYYVEVTDANGCSDSDSVTITVYELPGANLGNDQSVCSNELPATLTVQSTGNQLSYLWSTGQTTQQIQVSQAGTYSVTVINSNGCESADAIQVQVLTAPNVNAGNDITVCEYDFPVTLNATGNGATVLWSNGAATPFTSVTTGGTYSVTTTSQNGCQATDSVVVTSDPCLGIAENNIAVSIYPNPTNGIISIEINDNGIYYFELLNSTGQRELDGLLNDQKINLGNLANGAYIIRLFNSEKEFFGRIVKQ
ncbi:MAG: T9SS type A sorting domain-containing protein, partial [Bacteroidetes bacterium]|nr:T9SS type A sorting domain-containing protein [Bacteroidota bacterium]